MKPDIQVKFISPMEKCFLDEPISKKKDCRRFYGFSNQKICFQIALQDHTSARKSIRVTFKLTGNMAPYATVRLVSSVPNPYPTSPEPMDHTYLRMTPGLYPDLLRPVHYGGNMFPLLTGQLSALWVEVTPPAPGTGTLTFTLYSEDGSEEYLSESVTVTSWDVALPPQKVRHTEWFYTDCIAEQYHVRPFSEAHWKLIGNFLRTAAENGINMILTPIFTPELDTYIGGERLTTQLLDITEEDDGTYDFGLSGLERWVALCRSVGITDFEMPHFFTQWGALHAPKIFVKKNGKKIKKFGWHTDSLGAEYADFLRQLLECLISFFEEKGLHGHVWFHISDEPTPADLEHYLACKELIAPHIGDYPIIDALSDFPFYSSGALKKPVPAIRSVEPFLEAGIDGLWVYYCGDSSGENLTGRQLAMPLWRTRILGVQMYRYRVEGFLHWGYNFYHNRQSYEVIDPFGFPDCELFAPTGDAFLVYPGDDGQAWESLRLYALRSAMEDVRALELYEARFGREAAEQMLDDVAGMEITFGDYPHDGAFFDRLHKRIFRDLNRKKREKV